MDDFQIRTGGWEDEERLGALLSVSFTDDPLARWLMPNALDFLRDSKRHPRRAYSAAFDAETVFVIGDFAGAALWLPPDTETDRSDEIEQVGADLLEETVTFPKEFSDLISRCKAYRPSEPHWYLGLIAVDPAYRGRGIGTRLMEHCLSIVDEEAKPAYLESTNSANLSLYERFGFQMLAEVRVGRSPVRFPMIRRAQSRTVAGE